MNRFLAGADRLEALYLAALRIIVLVFATIALIVAGVVAVDGVRSLMTSTKVATDAVVVAPADVATALAQKQIEKDAALEGEAAIPEAAKTAQAAFLAGPFNAYYAVYKASAQTYNKPEDTILSKADLAKQLGYGVEAFAAGEDATVQAFAHEAAFAAQIVAAAKDVSARPAYVQQLVKYKAAEKTARTCSTRYVNRRVWDSSSTGCDGWWQSPIGCSVVRAMPVQECQAAYPDGIKGPGQAFAEFDAGFRALWLEKSAEVDSKAAAERAKRENLKDSGAPKLMKAIFVFGGFLAVMFLFLVIAVERHLRRIPKAQ
jgi:hypothetical protein